MTSSGCVLVRTMRRRCCWRRFRPVVSPLLPPLAHGLHCPVPARPCSCPGPNLPLKHEVAVFGSCRSVPAWCVVCGVHPPAPHRVCWHAFACLPGPPSMRGCSACGPGMILPRSARLRLILFRTCPPLCVGALWPAWVWRDVRSLPFFLLPKGPCAVALACVPIGQESHLPGCPSNDKPCRFVATLLGGGRGGLATDHGGFHGGFPLGLWSRISGVVNVIPR